MRWSSAVKIILLILTFLFLGKGNASAQALSLEEYLGQVREKSKALEAAKIGAEGARDRIAEKSLLTSPYFFTELQHGRDQSQLLDLLLFGEGTFEDRFLVGLEKKTRYGQSARLTYESVFANTQGLIPNLAGVSRFHNLEVDFEIRQSLWQNVFGRQVRAQEDAIEAKSRSEVEDKSFQMKQILVQAEVAYRKLAHARQVVGIQQNLLERARKLLAWASDRAKLKLLDQVDRMQAETEVQARLLELASAQDQERAVSAAFNLLRGDPSGFVAEKLSFLPSADLKIPALSEETPPRHDLQSLAYASQASRKEAVVKKHDTLPELEGFFEGSFNSFNSQLTSALSSAIDPQNFAYSVGVAFRLPLDFSQRKQVRKSYEKEALSTQYFLAQKTLEAESEWKELRRRLKEAYRQMSMARQLEELQKRKADYERARLANGNTVTFQVLQFEQDWKKSQLSRVEAEENLLEILARLKLFQVQN